MICVNCQKEIKKGEHYFEVNEYKEKELVNQRYVHKQCQDDYDNKVKSQLQVNEMATQFIQNANQLMKDMGAKEVKTIT